MMLKDYSEEDKSVKNHPMATVQYRYYWRKIKRFLKAFFNEPAGY